MTDKLEETGFALLPHAVAPDVVASLLSALEAAQSDNRPGVKRRGDSNEQASGVYAMRNLLDLVPAVRQLTDSAAVRALVEPTLGRDCFVARGILFDKTPDANWKVPWHQDLSIAVRDRIEVVGFGPWSRKAGVTHVQPPLGVLQNMLTLRLHLDACDENNGPLRVLPASHSAGKLDAAAIAQWRQQSVETSCSLPSGGVLLMRPLLLHASSPARTPRHRRVIHLEWAAEELPGGLQWYG